MRTSLNELKMLEDYLFLQCKPDEALVTEARLIVDRELREKLHFQKAAYRLVREYSRLKVKEEIEAIHRKLFTEPEHKSFRDRILRLFNKK